MDAASALADLIEISSQIETAVLVDGRGSVLAQTGPGGDRLARAGSELVRAAERFETEQRRLTQLEVALRGGSIFLVRSDARSIVARTSPRPASALVLHDLTACLGSITAKPRRRKQETVDA